MGSKYIKLRAVGLFMAVFCSVFLLHHGTGLAIQGISGARSNVFPDVATAGEADVRAMVQLVSDGVTEKSRTTIASIYVPQSVVNNAPGQQVTVNLTILGGCDTGNLADGGFQGWVANTFYRVEYPTDPNQANALTTSSVALTDSDAYCNAIPVASRGDVPISFVVGIPSAPTNGIHDEFRHDGYYVYRFYADAVGPETSRYLNNFHVRVDSPGGSLAGVAGWSGNCQSNVYPNSCPAVRSYTNIYGVTKVGSFIYSSFFGSDGNDFNVEVDINNNCPGAGSISLYDLDLDTVSQPNLSMELWSGGSGPSAAQGSSLLVAVPYAALANWYNGIPGFLAPHHDPNGLAGFSGLNNQWIDLPGGDASLTPYSTFNPNTNYYLIVKGVSGKNALQGLTELATCPQTPLPIVCTGLSIVGNPASVLPNQRFTVQATIAATDAGTDAKLNNILAAPPGAGGRQLQAGIVNPPTVGGDSPNWNVDESNMSSFVDSGGTSHQIPPDRTYLWGNGKDIYGVANADSSGAHEFSWVDGFYYQRLGLTNRTFQFSVQAPGGAGTYPLAIRMLDRDPPNGLNLGNWLKFDSSCQINVNVVANSPPFGAITGANCTMITGVATDKDWPAGGLRIDLRLDSPYNPVSHPGAEAILYTDSAGNWSWTIPQGYKAEYARSIWFDVLGKNSSGVDDQWVAGANSGGVTFGPCEFKPSGNITAANCQTISGNAFDANAPGGGLRVDIHMDVPNSGPGTTVYTDGAGNWSWTLPNNNTFKSSAVHRVYADILGVNSSGTPNEWIAVANSGGPTYGPCQNAVCSSITINGTGVVNGGTYNMYAGQTFTATMVFKNNAPVGGTSWTNAAYSAGTDTRWASGTQNELEPNSGSNEGPRLKFAEGGPISPNGGLATYAYTVRPPDTVMANIRTYVVEFRIVQDNVEWVGSSCKYVINVQQPPAIPQCSFISPIGAEPNVSFPIGVQIKNAQSHPLGMSFSRPGITLKLNSAFYNNNDAVYAPASVGPNQTADFTANTSYATVGNYIVTASLSNGSACPNVIARVTNHPYFKIYNGDVTVGAKFNKGDVTCSVAADTIGQIFAFAKDDITGGTSGEYSIVARKLITQAYSSSSVVTRTPLKEALTLANDVVGNAWGGNYGKSSCFKDYFTTTQKSTAAVLPAGTYTPEQLLASSVDNQVRINGNLTLSSTTTAGGFSGKLAVFVQGSVFVNGGTGVNLKTTYIPGTPSSIPFFAVVVQKGSIYVGKDIVTLDGMYVAQPDPATNVGGIIYTCAAGIGSLYSVGDAVTANSSQLDTLCNKQLTFNGSVVAKGIKLLRTKGTVSASVAAEQTDPTSPNIAEVFNGMPEMYIADTPFKLDAAENKRYDSAASLPPVL